MGCEAYPAAHRHERDVPLIELVADRLWLTADGHIKPFAGDMEDYARLVLERAKAGMRTPSQSADTAAALGDATGAKGALPVAQQAAQEARDAARKAAKKRRRRGR